MPYSVLILSKDEADNIEACINSVRGSDDVVLLDSFSTDQTVPMATRAGARIVQREFSGYASQRNFGLNEVAYKHHWVLMLDADERLPVETHEEIEIAISNVKDDVCLMFLRRRDHLFGKWIKRSSGYPTWFGRIARIGRVSVDREINEEYVTDGSAKYLTEHLDHFPFNKGMSSWLLKHDRYSSMEAQLMINRGPSKVNLERLFSKDTVVRRKELKTLAYAVPGRPCLMFFALYFFRGGFLEGRAGLTFCGLRAFYEFMIDCKYRELLRRNRGLPV